MKAGALMEDNYKIYVHINKKNKKMYIGQTKLKGIERFGLDGQRYKGCRKFYNAIKKYGWENFNHIILFENLSKDMADLIEQELIKKYNTTNNGYNINTGGKHYAHNDETKKILSLNHRGKNNPFYNKKHNKKTLSIISQKSMYRSRKKVINLHTLDVYESLFEASSCTKQSISKISQHCNINRSISRREWLFLNDYNILTEEEILSYMNFNKKDNLCKKVIYLENKKIFKSLREAERETGTEHTLISRHCRHLVDDPEWEYLNDYLLKKQTANAK